MTGKTTVPVYGGPSDSTVEIAPGQSVADLRLSEEHPRVGIFDWVPQGDGTYKPVARIHEKKVPLTLDMLRQLGLGIEPKTLRRLVIAGFVRGSQVSPRRWNFSLQSFMEHQDRVASDPEFWDEDHPDRNRKRYLLYTSHV